MLPEPHQRVSIETAIFEKLPAKLVLAYRGGLSVNSLQICSHGHAPILHATGRQPRTCSLVMEVTPSVPAKTVAEFIAYAKANPDKINMGSGGNGSTPHVAGELFKMMTGINMVHVPYRGSGAMFADLLGGQVGRF
jgi:Tripartite tricarboxylate transporter family receptor